jgi:hypothetical protein
LVFADGIAVRQSEELGDTASVDQVIGLDEHSP